MSNDFWYYYDQLSFETEYPKFYKYYLKILERYKLCPKLILDLGCGSGELAIRFANKKRDVIGIDVSGTMLQLAKEKALEKGKDILFLQQDMTKFELYGTVDFIYSSLDCVNYILKKTDLKKMFKLIKNYLNPGGLFVFDINSLYKFEHIFSDHVYTKETDELFLIWQNDFDKKSKRCNFYLDLFIKKGKTEYERLSEVHQQQAYSVDELKEMIEDAGLTITGIFDEFSFEPYNNTTERIFFVVTK